MQQLELSVKQALAILKKENFITEGIEGKLYHIPGAEDMLIKIYHNFQVPKNFKEKLESFHQFQDLDDIIARPLHLVTMNNVPIGYTMKEFGISLDKVNVPFTERVKILEQCRNIIQRLHEKGIILGDIKLQNFLYKDGQVKICDICNARVGTYDITVKNTITLFHESKRHVVDEYTDIQAFNYMTYIFLKYGMTNLKRKNSVHDFSKILQQDLQIHGMPYYFESEAYPVIKNIYQGQNQDSNEILLDHVKR